MSGKRKSTPPKRPSTRKGRPVPGPAPYTSLAEGPPPAERLARLLEAVGANGRKPMTEEEYDRHLEEFRDLWGGEEEIDALVAWVHRGRREGRYR